MGFVAQNAKVIDFLVLRGMYVSNYYVAKAYKENNPNGKVYIGLDANAYWMDGLDISDARASGLLDLCDLIATSGKETSRYLNYKWPWKVVHIANGYYDFSGKRPAPDYSKKKNVILTVGRLGTSQKRTDIILEAFANISDRELLFQEYLEAKIFAFPSEIEGGTPNVIGEALYGGCAMVTSRFDAGDEACDYGRCGRCVDIGEAQPFGNAILEMIEGDELEKLSTNAYEYGKNEFSMEKIVAQIYERIFGED